jgi:Leucine-rich repeat (LRR) protein
MPLIDSRSPLPTELYIDRHASNEDLKALPNLPFAEEIHGVRLCTSSELTDEAFIYVAQLPNLECLRITHVWEMTDQVLKAIGQMTKLKKLYICSTNIKGPGLPYLGSLLKLELLELSCSQLPLEAGLEHLGNLPNLHEVDLTSQNFTPAAFASLASLTQIRTLKLNLSRIQKQCELGCISRLTNLRHLDLHASELVPAILPYLVSLTELKTLRLSMTQMKDADVSYLGKLINLRELYLPCCLQDEALLSLLSLTKLERLNISSWGIDPSVEAKLKEAMPNLQVVELQEMDDAP